MSNIVEVIKAIGRDIKALTTKLEELKQKVGTGSNDPSGSAGAELKGQGFPYNLNAEIGTTYIDTTAKNGAFKWIRKRTRDGRDKWDILSGDTGQVRARNINSTLGASYMEFRRINSTVEINFGGLAWGWFGIRRRNSPGYVPQGSDRERNVVILNVNGIPLGFRPIGSKIGMITNDKGQRLGTWYLGGPGDGNQFRLQFDDPVPTDKDIGDIRFSSVIYVTDDPWPDTL